jgi:hypothetical protein
MAGTGIGIEMELGQKIYLPPLWSSARPYRMDALDITLPRIPPDRNR